MTADGRVDRHDAGDSRADGVMDGEGRTLSFIYGSCQTYSISRYERCHTGHVALAHSLQLSMETAERSAAWYLFWCHSKISAPCLDYYHTEYSINIYPKV